MNNNNLKKILQLLLTGVIVSANISFAQTGGLKDMVGLWTSKQTSVVMTFQFDKDNKIQLAVVDTSGEVMQIKRLRVDVDTVYTVEKFRSTHWITRNKYYLTTKDSLVNLITNTDKTVIFVRKE